MLWERQRAVMGPGAGATAHWVAAGGATKVRSSHRTSNSVPFRLILTICLPLLLSLCASGSLAGASRCARGPPPAPSWLARAVGPQTLPPAPRPDLLVDPVAAEASSRRALWRVYCCNGRRVAGAVCYGTRESPARCPAARARSGGGPRLRWDLQVRCECSVAGVVSRQSRISAIRKKKCEYRR